MDINAIFRWAPDYWRISDGEQTDLPTSSDEYQQIAFEVRHVLCNFQEPIGKIIRVQKVHELAHCLVRGQLWTTASMSTVYRVRRFIKIQKQYVPNALQWNLDHRRCDISETVFKTIIPSNHFYPGDVLLVVQVLTNDQHASVIRPNTNLEYFIDYIVYL